MAARDVRRRVDGVDEEPGRTRGRLDGTGPRRRQLERPPQPAAAVSGQQWVLDRAEAGCPPLTHPLDVGQQVLGVDGVDHCEGGGAGDGVPAERRAVVAGAEQPAGVADADARPQRQPAGETLGHCDDVGQHPLRDRCEPVPGASDTALHLVHDEQGAGPVTGCTCSCEIALGCRDDPTLAEGGLEEDGGHGVVHGRLERVDVPVGHEAHRARQRLEGPTLGRRAGDGQRAESPAVKASLRRHDAQPTTGRVQATPVDPGQLQGALVGLGAVLAEEDPTVRADQVKQSLGQAYAGLVREQVARVCQCCDLSSHRLDDRRVAVTKRGDGHPAVVEAVTRQVAALAHTRTCSSHEPGVRLAERLLGLLGRTVGSSSPGRRRGQRVRPEAGRIRASPGTVGGRCASSPPRAGSTAGRWARWRSPASRPSAAVRAVARAVTSCPTATSTRSRRPWTHRSAVVLETMLGEGGVVPAPDGYLAAARAAWGRAGALLVVDEVQTGIGRTGQWFADHARACARRRHGRQGPRRRAADRGVRRPRGRRRLFSPGDHGSTFGGNPVSCAAALAVIDTIDAEDLLTHVKRRG